MCFEIVTIAVAMIGVELKPLGRTRDMLVGSLVMYLCGRLVSLTGVYAPNGSEVQECYSWRALD